MGLELATFFSVAGFETDFAGLVFELDTDFAVLPAVFAAALGLVTFFALTAEGDTTLVLSFFAI